MTKKSRNFTIEEDVLEKIINAAEKQGLSCSALMEKAAKAWLDKHENSKATLTQAMRDEVKQLIKEELALQKESKFNLFEDNIDTSNLNLPW